MRCRDWWGGLLEDGLCGAMDVFVVSEEAVGDAAAIKKCSLTGI